MPAARNLFLSALVLTLAGTVLPAQAQEAPRPWGSAARSGSSDARATRRTREVRPAAERDRRAGARADERRVTRRSADERNREAERRRLARQERQQIRFAILQAQRNQQAAERRAEERREEERRAEARRAEERPRESYASAQCGERFYSDTRERQCRESGASGAVINACVRALYGAEAEIACLSAARDAAQVAECAEAHADSDDILACLREPAP